jgi:hypothetical protein
VSSLLKTLSWKRTVPLKIFLGLPNVAVCNKTNSGTGDHRGREDSFGVSMSRWWRSQTGAGS